MEIQLSLLVPTGSRSAVWADWKIPQGMDIV